MAKSNRDLLMLAQPNVSAMWQDRISKVVGDFWDARKAILTSDEFTPLRNEVFNALVNRIGLTTLVELNTINPLALFKESEGLLNGDTIQEIGTTISSGEQFAGVENPTDQFLVDLPEVKAAYHRINRQMRYRKTIGDPQLRRAFLDDGGLEVLLGEVINSLYRSNEVDEYIFTKRLLADLYLGRNLDPSVQLQPTQKVSIPDITDLNATEEDIRLAILKIRNTASQMRQNTDAYNQIKRTQASRKEDQILILNYRAVNQNQVQFLTKAFHTEYADMGMEIVEVDGFEDASNPSDGSQPLVGVICDRRYIQIRQNYQAINPAVNAASLYTTYWYHNWQLYLASPFRNAIYLTGEPVKAA